MPAVYPYILSYTNIDQYHLFFFSVFDSGSGFDLTKIS